MFQFPIHIVDDEEDIRDALSLLLTSVGYEVVLHENGESLLSNCKPNDLATILLDVRMPNMSGLSVQKKLLEAGHVQPIIFMSGHGDIAMAVEAVKNGALDFLEKPFRDVLLFDAVERSFLRLKEESVQNIEKNEIQAVVVTLTSRELDVMNAVAEGLSNKVIARNLNISPRTVEIHRAHVFEKLDVDNAQQLIRKLAMVGLLN